MHAITIPNIDLSEDIIFQDEIVYGFRRIDSILPNVVVNRSVVSQLLANARTATYNISPSWRRLRSFNDDLFWTLNPALEVAAGRSQDESAALEAISRTDIHALLKLMIDRKSHPMALGGYPVRGRSRSKPDANNVYVEYPKIEDGWSKIEELHTKAKTIELVSPSLFSVVVMMTILTTHLFEDGNGRISRILLNKILIDSSHLSCYLPLYEVGAFARGSWMLAIRSVQINGDWREMLNFLSKVVENLSRLQHDAVVLSSCGVGLNRF